MLQPYLTTRSRQAPRQTALGDGEPSNTKLGGQEKSRRALQRTQRRGPSTDLLQLWETAEEFPQSGRVFDEAFPA